MRFPLNILTDALLYFRGPGVCQLRRDLNSSLAEGWQRPLPLQRLRPLLQNEWYKSAPGQTKTQNGKSKLAKKSLINQKRCYQVHLLKYHVSQTEIL